MALPSPGASISGQYVYTLQIGVEIPTIGMVDLVHHDANNTTLSYSGSGGAVQSIAFGGNSYSVNPGSLGRLQDSSAFTFTSGNTTYLVSNGPLKDLINIPFFGEALALTELTHTQNQYTPCYLTGTRLRTPSGEAAVETLAAGDLVTTASGEARRVKWVGYRNATMVGLKERDIWHPVRIARGAVSDNVPCRDLLVSPEHAIYLDGVLVPARHLVNGTTIARVTGLPTVQYFHVELESHDLLLAEGLPAESWLDTGNRAMFENADQTVVPHPALAARAAANAWASQACAELVTEGPALAAIRDRLIARAIALGALTRDPGLMLQVDGAMLRPLAVEGVRHRFAVPKGAREISIVSRSARGADVLGYPTDQRRLGVALSAIALTAAGVERRVSLTDPALCDGFNQQEGLDGVPFRWTDGAARLPASILTGFDGGCVLTLDVVGAVPYPVERPSRHGVYAAA